ncbi:MAG: Mov34/MPN/PAD-1 family protein [Promethearchaeota archaeon]
MTINKDYVFPVYIYENVLNGIKDLCKNYENEIFGYLIGLICKWKEQIYIIIEDKIFIEETFYSHKVSFAQIEGTAGKYDKEFQKLKKNNKNKNLWVVGWWHSHPNLGCFLSPTDLKTQQHFFPENFQVALVIDPIKDTYDFYTLDNASKKKYKTISNAIISKN